jgi:hypothetical protein
MGDKNPKAKQRSQQQKSSAKASNEAKALSKQQGYSQAPPLSGKGKR